MSLRLSDIRMMILCQYPLSALEYGNCYYDGDGVAKDLEEAYVWYKVAECAGDSQVDGFVFRPPSRPPNQIIQNKNAVGNVFNGGIRLTPSPPHTKKPLL